MLGAESHRERRPQPDHARFAPLQAWKARSRQRPRKGRRQPTEPAGEAHVKYAYFRLKSIPTITLHVRSEEHTSELQSPCNLVCRLLLEKKKKLNILY